MLSLNTKFKRIVSLARKRVRNPEKEKQFLCEYLPKYAVTVPEDGGMLEKPNDMFFKSNKAFTKFVLEIGFGAGENIIFNAKNNPNFAYVGCEVFAGGVVDLLKEIEENKIENIKIWFDDALELITRLPKNSLDLVYILHPDPWPKKRHNKRRLINFEFLSLIETKMARSGEILIITDHQDYADYISEVVDESKELFVTKYDNYPPITKTKYRLKADALGIESRYFYLVKK